MGPLLSVAAALAPLYVASATLSEKNVAAALGSVAGILGLSFLLIAAAISVRIPRFDARFGGLTELWKLHHILGAASFILIMAHPLLLAFSAARVSLHAAGDVLVPPAGTWSLWAGWLAFAALAIFLAPTFWFFGRPEYQRWKAIHAVSGLVIVLALAHAAPLGRSASLRIVWIAYGSLALVAFIYRKFAAPLIARKPYAIVRVDAVNRGVVELSLAPEGQMLDYRAGQFVYLTPLDPALAAGRNEEHPYTLSSAPGEPALRVAIKDAGDATHALQTVACGSRALVEGPYGDFFPENRARAPALWIAGGIGIAPFLSRARSLTPAEAADIHLVYCVEDEARAHFFPELERIAAAVGGFKFSGHFYSREGALNIRFIAARCPDFAAREIYVCGPPALIAAAVRELQRAGVPAGRIRSEDFTWL